MAKKTTTRKKKRKVNKNDQILRLTVNTEEGFEFVEVGLEHKKSFIENFGVLEIPSKADFEEWKNSL